MKGSKGAPGTYSPGKIFENLHTVVAILVLFEQIKGTFCLNFLPLILSVSPNMMHFVRTFSIMRARSGHKAYCYRKGSKLWKSCIHQKHV